MNRKANKVDPITRLLSKPIIKKPVTGKSFVKKDQDKLLEIKQRPVSSIYNTLGVSLFRENKNSDQVFVISESFSKQDFDISKLLGFDIISASENLANGCSYFITTDYGFVNERLSYIKKLNQLGTKTVFVKSGTGEKSTVNAQTLPEFNFTIDSVTEFSNLGFSNKISDFINGSSSDYCAIQLAVLLGYKNIYLVGFKNKRDYNTEKLIKALSLYKHKGNIKSFTDFSGGVLEVVDYDKDFDKNKSENLNNNLSDLIVVGYYTQHTPYEQEAKKLIQSCTNFGLEFDIQAVPNQGSWQLNTRYKAQFMLKMLQKHGGKRLLYVDCDAEFKKSPDLFINYSADIAVRFQDFPWKKNECLSGTIYMENNLKTMKLCELWISENQNDPKKERNLEQWNLGQAIVKMTNDDSVVCKNLPPEYTFIFDSMRKIYPGVEPVIEHYQASRKFKRII
jgi:hypothetical protein